MTLLLSWTAIIKLVPHRIFITCITRFSLYCTKYVQFTDLFFKLWSFQGSQGYVKLSVSVYLEILVNIFIIPAIASVAIEMTM